MSNYVNIRIYNPNGIAMALTSINPTTVPDGNTIAIVIANVGTTATSFYAGAINSTPNQASPIYISPLAPSTFIALDHVPVDNIRQFAADTGSIFLGLWDDTQKGGTSQGMGSTGIQPEILQAILAELDLLRKQR